MHEMQETFAGRTGGGERGPRTERVGTCWPGILG